MSVLLKLYRGEISAVDDVVPQSLEYKKAIELLCKEREYLEKVRFRNHAELYYKPPLFC